MYAGPALAGLERSDALYTSGGAAQLPQGSHAAAAATQPPQPRGRGPEKAGRSPAKGPAAEPRRASGGAAAAQPPQGRRRGGPGRSEPETGRRGARSGAEGERSEPGAAQGRPAAQRRASWARAGPGRSPTRSAADGGREPPERRASAGADRPSQAGRDGDRRGPLVPPQAAGAAPERRRAGGSGAANSGAGPEGGRRSAGGRRARADHLCSDAAAAAAEQPGRVPRRMRGGARPGPMRRPSLDGGEVGLRHTSPPWCSLIIDHEKNKSAKNVRHWRTLGRQKYPGRLTEVRRPGILAEMPEFAVLASRQVRGSAPIPQPIEFYHIGRGESSVATSRQGRFFCAEKRERRG